ncbi:NAD(P)/FAD-dependent oxidoreductase [Rhodococcus sp. ACPA1]|uniref:NAD(P)/FAD-dependent oxidoreductase n=1 Tax=Rhodococcus sp. ACPA1 TaxID=2028572 RepID=UPI0015C92196|nr:FAD-dependent oxidoreductase [Rhodococcus sp. ACPA1]
MPKDTIIIGGAGHAGVQAAVRLRELDWPGRILMIAPDSEAPYERPPLSKDFLKPGSSDDAVPLRKAGYFEDKGIERVQGRIHQVVRDGRHVLLEDGSRHDYVKLILAPGSKARRLTVPGSDVDGIYQLKTWEDAAAVKGALGPGTRVAVIGAGYIGLEVAAAAASLGCETTILEFQDRVMSRVTSEPVSRFFERVHETKGTRLVFGAAVAEVRGDDRVREIVTSDGTVYPADVVIVGIGVVPLQELAQDCGLRAEDGIIVDRDGRTSDPDIYAAGDATRLVDEGEGINRRLESIQNAVVQGANAANHIMGAPTDKREVPWFWTVQHGVRLQTAGVRDPDDTVVVRGSEGEQFSVLYLREGRLAAIDTVGSLRDFNPGKKLIAAGVPLDPERAADPSIKLSEAARDLATRKA